MGGFSIWHWLIVLAVVLVVFGTKRLTSGAKDLGGAVKEFKKGMRDDDKPAGRLGDAARERGDDIDDVNGRRDAPRDDDAIRRGDSRRDEDDLRR